MVSELVDADVTGERTKVGGLIAFRYDDLAVTPPVDGESDLIFVFDGDVQYQLNCQSTPTHRDRMDEACDLAVDTLRRPPERLPQSEPSGRQPPSRWRRRMTSISSLRASFFFLRVFSSTSSSTVGT